MKIAIISIFALATYAQATPQYRIVELVGFTGSWGSWANDMNNKGEVVGYAADDFGEYRALFWDAGGNLVNLGGTGPYSSKAYGISENGIVCGWSDQRSGRVEPVVWGANSQPQYLPILPGQYGGICMDINDRGIAIGVSVNSAGDRTAVAWVFGQVMAIAPRNSWPIHINANGETAGVYDTTVLPKPAKMYHKSGHELLPSLGSDPGYAYDVNDSGAAIGSSLSDADGKNHVVLWNKGQLIDLGAGLAGRGAYVHGMNNRTDHVGMYLPVAGNYRPYAVLGGTTIDLIDHIAIGLPDWTELHEVWDINDSGVIIGQGYRSGNLWYDRAFKLIPLSD
jgi:probable HAF family extracellular repeat protein